MRLGNFLRKFFVINYSCHILFRVSNKNTLRRYFFYAVFTTLGPFLHHLFYIFAIFLVLVPILQVYIFCTIYWYDFDRTTIGVTRKRAAQLPEEYFTF